MTVHGAIYVDVPWHPVAQPEIERDRWVQRGEIISVWTPAEGESASNWPAPWHVENPGVLRFILEGVTLPQVQWIVADWRIPTDKGDYMVAKRLWRFDIDTILAAEAAVLGRPVDPQIDVLVLTLPRIQQWVKRVTEGGVMLNKAAGDLALNNPARVTGEV